MKKIFQQATLAVALTSLGIPPASATNTASQPQTETAPENGMTAGEDALDNAAVAAAQPAPVDPGVALMEQIDDWKSGAGSSLAEKAENGEIFMSEGIAVVKVTPESRDWADHRILAYKEALMGAQSQYIEWEGIRARAETLSRFFDDRTQMPSFEPGELQNTSKLAEVLDKAVALAGGLLDEKLVELGIDPAEFKAAPPEKRAQIFENSISEKIAVSARASLIGLVPVKTFEANDADGNHAIAVVAVASNKMRQFIYEMKNSRGDMAPVPKRPARSRCMSCSPPTSKP
ncbi:DUF6844 domain-containing protein [Marinobacterium aestuariivivens]